MDFFRELGMVKDYAQFAQTALYEEQEGNFKYYVDQLAAIAKRLDEAVKDM